VSPHEQPRNREQLARYLDLCIEALEEEQKGREDRRRAEAVRREVAQMVVRAILLSVYSLVLGGIYSPPLLASMANPAAFGTDVRLASGYANLVMLLVPDSLRAPLVAAASSVLLLGINSASSRVRSAAGGTIFAGVTTLSLLGFSSAASTGPTGWLWATPGLVASGYILYRFLAMLHRMESPTLDDLAKQEGPDRVTLREPDRPQPWLLHALDDLIARTHPMRSVMAAIVFLVLPALSLAAVIGVAVVDQASGPGPFLYWISWSGQRAFLVWCTWACATTPVAIRIPLWSTVVWTALVAPALFFTPVSAIFLLAVAATLVITAMISVLGWSGGFRMLWVTIGVAKLHLRSAS
jgi:hypothetical protein